MLRPQQLEAAAETEAARLAALEPDHERRPLPGLRGLLGPEMQHPQHSPVAAAAAATESGAAGRAATAAAAEASSERKDGQGEETAEN